MSYQRAYSPAFIKAIDDERRTLSGIASTPEVDRVGDIVEPLGAEYADEIPLLLGHDPSLPVGLARLRKQKDGISFDATIPAIAEPGTLRDRVLLAWQSLKAQLIRGVSIGFRPFDDGVELLKSGGLHFKRYEVLELSLVSVPANLQATVTAIKSLAASGLIPVNPAGVTASIRPEGHPMTNTEQIAATEAARAAAVARMGALMTAAGEKGETLGGEEADEYDGLKTKVKQHDAHLVRLRDMEELTKAAAVPVRGATPADASVTRGRPTAISVQLPTLPPGLAFTRMVLCKAASFILMRKGEFKSAYDIARERYPSDDRIAMALKAAVPPATPTDPAWAGVLIDPTNLAGEFIEFLRPRTILGQFGTNGIPPLNAAPFNVRFIGETNDGDAYWVGAGKPKPLTKFGYEATTLGFAKLASITVITQEVARFSTPSAELLARNGLAKAIQRRMDIDFIDPVKAAVANVSPASITNGVTPLTSAGNDPVSIRQDIHALVSAYVAGNQSVGSLVFIMPATVALSLSLMRSDLGNKEFPDVSVSGGSIEGISTIVSEYAALGGANGNVLIAVNANEIYLADDGQVTVDASTEASLEMSDTPTQNGAAGTGADLVSLWQNNLIGLRAERFVNWQKRRPEAVVWMNNITWGQPTGSP